MRIGFIGLGAMGLPMTRHLLAAGHEVTVASRSRGPIDAAIAAGAHEGDGPRGVVADERGDDPLRAQLARGRRGARRRACRRSEPGKIVVDTSTIDPDVERDAARAGRARPARRYLDAPLSGGTVGAERGNAHAHGRRRRRRARRGPARARSVRGAHRARRRTRAWARS